MPPGISFNPWIKYARIRVLQIVTDALEQAVNEHITRGVKKRMCQAEKRTGADRPAAPEASEPETELLAEAKAAGLFLDRELSWLQFNRRVLEQAGDPTVPLLGGSNSSVFTARISKSFHGTRRLAHAPRGAAAGRAG